MTGAHIQSTAFGAAECLIKDSPELLDFAKWLICIYCNNACPSSLFSMIMQNLALSSCDHFLHWWGNHTWFLYTVGTAPMFSAVISSKTLLFAAQSHHWFLSFRSLLSVPLKKPVRPSRSPARLMCPLSSHDPWSPPDIFHLRGNWVICLELPWVTSLVTFSALLSFYKWVIKSGLWIRFCSSINIPEDVSVTSFFRLYCVCCCFSHFIVVSSRPDFFLPRPFLGQTCQNIISSIF